MRKMVSATRLLIVAMLASGVASAQEAQNLLIDCLHTVVGDSIITMVDVESGAHDSGDGELLDKYLAHPTPELRRERIKLGRQVLTNLIDQKVVLQEFKSLGKKNPEVQVPETVIDEEVNEVIRERFGGNRVAFAQDLRNQGKTLEKFRRERRDAWINAAMRNTFVKEQIISPRKIEEYYTSHPEKFKLEDQIKFRLISLSRSISDTEGSTKRRAEEILSQIKGGAQFSEMAKSYSEGSQRNDGGLTDWQDVSVINKVLVAELEKLKPGENSGVIETPEAFFILRLEDRRAAHVKPLGDVRDEIERELVINGRQAALSRWYGRLRAKTYVQTFAPARIFGD